MNTQATLSPSDINAVAHAIDTEAAQLQHSGQSESARFRQLAQELDDLRAQCPHTTTFKSTCVDCGKTL